MLSLAIVGLGIPRRFSVKEAASTYVAEIGLIGASAELAMAACIVQVNGPDAMKLRSGSFKSASEILEEFRRILRHPVPRAAFLTQGVPDQEAHRRALLENTKSFKVLMTARAGGLHAGQGPTRDVCVVLARDVASFLELLARSSRIRPYLESIPVPPETVKERTVLVEELARVLENTANITEQGHIVTSLYLVSPELPEEEPDWVQALSRVSVTPHSNDVNFLLRTLEDAVPVSLLRVTPGVSRAHPVVVRSEDASALPISPHFLTRALTDVAGQCYADLSVANGRLNQGLFHPIPLEFIFELFATGIEEIGLLNDTGVLSAHEVWPFVASSLSVAGTPGPYWFLVRTTTDYGQLRSLVQRASKFGNAYLKRNKVEFLEGLRAIAKGRPLAPQHALTSAIPEAEERAERAREGLLDAIARNAGRAKELGPTESELVAAASSGNVGVGEVILDFLNHEQWPSEQARSLSG